MGDADQATPLENWQSSDFLVPGNFCLLISLSLLTEHFHWVLESFSEQSLGKRHEMFPPLCTHLNLEAVETFFWG